MGTTLTLNEFWDEQEVNHVFCASTANPIGTDYYQNLESDGEDYCDVHDLLFADGLTPSDVSELRGEVVTENGDSPFWVWNGKGKIKDYKGNSITRLELYAI